MKNSIILLFFLLTFPAIFSQNINDQGIFLKENAGADRHTFSYNFEIGVFPDNITDYTIFWHSIPVAQGRSGTCWAYSAASFLESELYRLHNKKIKLSEMFIVYYEYIDRAIHFAGNEGKTYIGQGSENNAVLRIMSNYGLLPYEKYTGLLDGKFENDHSVFFKEYSDYLDSVKKTELLNEEQIVLFVKRLLDKHFGTPPDSVQIDGEWYTPKSYLSDYLKLNTSQYFSFMSTKELSYNTKHELVEDDNWWHGKDYYNLSLEDFMQIFHRAIIAGYTISLCGDVTEAGYDRFGDIAIVPYFDIPADYIDENSRQFRLSNNTTIDDHCIHVVGYQKYNDVYWYLIKDSGRGAFAGNNKGYRFYHQDYVKLKMIHFMIHSDPARDILDKIIK